MSTPGIIEDGVLPAASLIVVGISGSRTRVPIRATPFHIGRQEDNDLVLHDTRASRRHARIVVENGTYIIEDCDSLHGVQVNGETVARQPLRSGDNIEFGARKGYRVIFFLDDEIRRLAMQLARPAPAKITGPAGTTLAKLRALLEVARALESSLSTDEVLGAVVDAAIAITGGERGFLLLKSGGGLEVKIAHDRHGLPLPKSDLDVPAEFIQRALERRREALFMNFGLGESSGEWENLSAARLALRSAVCVPLVRVRVGEDDRPTTAPALRDTVGVIYVDSRSASADLSFGNRELLETLALEASAIIENARLLEEDRARQIMEEELDIARTMQQSLLPAELPATGWFRAAGWNVPSLQVGGDYFDVRPVSPVAWMIAVADVSGKGVGSALLAALLQGALLAVAESEESIRQVLARLNRYLIERARGEKYATLFLAVLDAGGLLRWINAGHPPAMLVSSSGGIRWLRSTAMPVGMIEEAIFPVSQERLAPGDLVVLFSDGLSEAQGGDGESFGAERIRRAAEEHARHGCAGLAQYLRGAVEAFTEGSSQQDDMTLVVYEYRP